MLSPKFGFAVEYVKDIERATRFYTETFGLEVERSHPTFVQFASFALASDVGLDGTRDTEMYWLVEDAEAAHAELAKRTEITLALSQKPFGKVFGVRDPDGHPRYLLELAKNRPSKAV